MVVFDERVGESVRDRKKRETRSALKRAAIALVAQRGLGAVTAEQIAARAGVSPRTFFNYFATKEDALVGHDPQRIAEMVDALRRRPASEPPLPALRAVLVESLPPSDAEPAELLERLRVLRSEPQLLAYQALRFEDLERALAQTLSEREGTDPANDYRAFFVVACVMAAGRAALMAWCGTDGREPLDRVLAHHIDLLATGLAATERSTS
ncbi:MAG: TetR/AcrR family transcriptional regulator [Acidimicrobiales bacterium]